MSNPPISYWGSSSVTTGKVRRLSVTCFKDLVERVICVPVPHPLSRKEFWDLPDDKARDRAKDAAFICACSFSGAEESPRNDASATSLVGVIIDLDSGEFLREFAEHPETLSDQLYPFNHVIWHTAKSRPEAPRLKIMVDVSPCAKENLKRILAFIIFRLGLPSDFKGRTESSVISQPQYRPLQFRGDTSNAVIGSRVNGIPLHISDLPELEPDEEELVSGRTYADPDGGGDEDFYGLAYLPVPGLKLEDIREALDTIDSDVTRPIWISIAAALKHQFSDDEDTAREAYEEFVRWSERGTKFAGRTDCWSTWRSWQAYAKGRPPITIRTLFHHAQEAGWENTKAAIKLSQTVLEWFTECQDPELLMQEGPKRIASMIFKNDVVEESLITALRKRLMALDTTIDKNTIKKEVNRVRRVDKKTKQEERGDTIPSWLRPFIFVGTTDTFNHMGTGVTLKPGAFDRFFAKELLPPDETPANGMPIIQPSAFALNIHKILRVDSTAYDPTQSSDEQVFLDPETGRLLLNSYDFNSPPVADPEFKDAAEALIRELVGYLIKEKPLQEIFLDYLARLHQAPGVKIPWSFMIQSAPGAGKGTLSEILEATLGHQNLKVVSPAQMSSQFNDWATNAVAAILNEVHIPGDRRDAVMNSLKPLISDPVISLNLKHRDGDCRFKNVVNYLAFSNYRDAAHLAADDRRWCICFSPIQTKEKSEALQTSGRFDAIRWLTTSAGASALRYFFLKRVISPDFPLKGHAPHTIYKAEVIEQSKNHLQINIEDTIEDGLDPLITHEVIHEGRVKELLCRQQSRDASLLPRYLSLMGYERESGRRVQVDGVRGHVWVHTERWTGTDAVAYLKARLKEVPGLEDEEMMFS